VKNSPVHLPRPSTWFLLGLLALPSMMLAQGSEVIDVGKFSAADVSQSLPLEWKPLYFKKIERHTVYTLVSEDSMTVIRAVADASASGLTREVRINPKQYPVIQWQWKITNLLNKSDVYKKEGDDYSARVYITFEVDRNRLNFFEQLKHEAVKLLYGKYPPLAAINYIWAAKGSKGLVVPNSYTDKAMMIIVESGEEKLNQWVSEERNVTEDYQLAFEQEPPMISGVAIMTDTDNTGESATAYYGDILFKQGGN